MSVSRSPFVPWRRDAVHPQGALCTPSVSSPLNGSTTGLLALYRTCNQGFKFLHSVPRRCLTKPSVPVHNNDFDNRLHDYILHVNDTLSDDHGNTFAVLDLLGTGTFGQVVKCRHQGTGETVAVKVIKNQPAYFNQAWVEINILRMLHRNNSQEDTRHIVKFYSHFIFRGHLCLVFEQLSINLYELLKQNSYVGISLEMLRSFLSQILQALNVLVQSEVIHCDLKPENILLKSLDNTQLKVIDFGSACQLHYPVYSYVQSRFYRSPEVLLGAPEYDSKIDMWSIGCIAGELFLGIPLFPGQNEMNMICRIVEMLGDIPDRFLGRCRNTNKFFNCARSPEYGIGEMHVFRLKSFAQYEQETSKSLPEWKRFFKEKKLKDIIMTYPYRSVAPHTQEIALRESLIDLISGMLRYDPRDRWTPAEALQHPFVRGEPLPDGQPWVPPLRPRRVIRSRPVIIEPADAEEPSPVDGLYSASAPNFTAKGHLNMNTTWGTGAGGHPPAVFGTGPGGFQIQHQQHHPHHFPFHETSHDGTESPDVAKPYAPGSYVPSSTLGAYGPSMVATGSRRRSAGPGSSIPTASVFHEPRAPFFPSGPPVDASHRGVPYASDSPSNLRKDHTPPLPYMAARRMGSGMHISRSKESLTGSLRMSASRESLGMGRTPSIGDLSEDPMFPFASDDEGATPGQNSTAHQYQHQQQHHMRQLGGSGALGTSSALPPPGPWVQQQPWRFGTSVPSTPSTLASVGYMLTNETRRVAFNPTTGVNPLGAVEVPTVPSALSTGSASTGETAMDCDIPTRFGGSAEQMRAMGQGKDLQDASRRSVQKKT